MITVPALKVRQFNIEFYEITFSADDAAKLVEFVVLDAGPLGRSRKRKGSRDTAVKWDVLESLVKSGDTAYQRPIIKKKIEELVEYYQQCAEEDRVPMPAIPGAVILVAREPVKFIPSGQNPDLGLVQIPEQYGFLHALDGQHRLVALHAATHLHKHGPFHVPAILFDRLESSQEVEMFSTINCKQTKLNSSLLVHLAGKRLYAEPRLVAAHEIARKLNEDQGSPLAGEIRMLGVGKGRINQVSLTNPLMAFLTLEPRPIQDLDEVKEFFLRYFKQLGNIFPEAWAGRKYSIKSAIAIRAFILAAPELIRRLRESKQPVTDAIAIRRLLESWKNRITSSRFLTEGEWKRKLAVSARKSSELLARELIEALELEEE